MATGESTFSTGGRKVSKFESKPLPIDKEYEFKLGKDWDVKVADGAGKLPYLNGRLELLGTANKEGGKNRVVFHRFFLSVTPGKDGVANVDRGDGITALCKSLGVDLEGVPLLEKTKGEGDDAVQVTILGPKAVKAWLLAQDGATGKVWLKNEKDQNGVVRNKVDFFIPATEEAADEGSEGSEGADEETEGEDEDEEEAPKAAKKGAPAKKGKK